ncbi:MAG TPA: hypothetical protein VF086_09060, partial [Propionibacteriaceae bacterium]
DIGAKSRLVDVVLLPATMQSEERMPNMCWKVVPDTIVVRELPMILIALTRPPQAPAPSQLVI